MEQLSLVHDSVPQRIADFPMRMKPINQFLRRLLEIGAINHFMSSTQVVRHRSSPESWQSCFNLHAILFSRQKYLLTGRVAIGEREANSTL